MTVVFKESPSDLFKTLNDRALAAGRLLQSKQTGYVHYYYGEAQQEFHTIPVFENTLFILALLRSRLVEQIQEAKLLLKGLLQFQNRQESDSIGNFPVYLHAYPVCQDSMLGLQLLAPFYWIIKQFGHILGTELKSQIEKASRLAIEYSLRTYAKKPFSYSFAVRLAAAEYAYGTLWEDFLLQQKGEEQLTQLSQKELEGWNTTKQLSELLVGLQMVYPSLLNSPWKELWHYMEQTWYHQTGCYIGPCIREWQEGDEPQANLYDLYGGYFAGHFSRRAILFRPYHLQGALIQPSPDKFDTGQQSSLVKGHLRGQSWQIVCHPKYAYTVLEKKEDPSLTSNKMYTPFRLIWGDLHRLHSLVCQGGYYEKVEYIDEGHSLKLIFKLGEPADPEGSYPQREIEFFADFYPDFVFTLNGQSTTTFELGEKVILSFDNHSFTFVMDLLEGEGTFLGHIMRGNRPSQINDKGEKRFLAYDWTFFLRTIRRHNLCRIQVTFSNCG